MSKETGDWVYPPPIPDPPRCRVYIACPTTYRAECRAAQRCVSEGDDW